MRSFRRALIFIGAITPAIPVQAVPLVNDPSYTVELLASGVGAADGMTLGADGSLYVTDYQGGRILKIEDPATAAANSHSAFASGIAFPTDISSALDGNLYVTSSTGSSSTIYQYAPDGTGSIFVAGFSFPTSIASYGSDLYVSNSGDGTISKVAMNGNSTTYASGFSAPNGPFGVSADPSGLLYTVDHGTGRVFSVASDGALGLLGSVSPLGGAFTAMTPDLDLLVSDVLAGVIYEFDLLGNRSVFASGFAGKGSPPVIGPTGLVFDASGNLYVGDGENVWRFAALSVPVPGTLALLVLAGLGVVRSVRRGRRGDQQELC